MKREDSSGLVALGEPGSAAVSAAPVTLTHLQRLEAESIHIMREVVAECEKPVMLYSIGKDSAVMLHLARKAFYPSPPPFPLLHVDTTWKFRAMYEFRDRMAREAGMELLVYQNPEACALGINPFDHGSQVHTDMWKTEGLKQALDQYGFDAAFGGARRDEEKSRAKERIFSFRSRAAPLGPEAAAARSCGASTTRASTRARAIRVFPLSNWTELDVWQYIHLREHPDRAALLRGDAAGGRARRHADHGRRRPHAAAAGRGADAEEGALPHAGLLPADRRGRVRRPTRCPRSSRRCCWPRTSERQGRVIDHDSSASMEKKKQEGYF